MSPDVLFAGASPLEDAIADTWLEDHSRWLILELARLSYDGVSGGGPPHAEIDSEVAESFLARASHRYFLHNRLDRGCLDCHALALPFLHAATLLARNIGGEGV